MNNQPEEYATAIGTTIAVKIVDTVAKELNRLHTDEHLVWREIAQLPQYQGIPAGTLCSIAKDRLEPRRAKYRRILGLPALYLAPACVRCGKVHTTKRCTDESLKKPRKKPVQYEQMEQQALLEWAGMVVGRYPELETLYAIPNAGKRSRIHGDQMRRAGLRKGMPDIHLPIARGGYHSLYIELKAIYPDGTTGKATVDQIRMAELLDWHGNKVVIAIGWEEAKNEIIKYLENDNAPRIP